MRRILVIEDEQLIRETLSDLLALMGYEVLQASNGIEGLAHARKESIDIILCDVNMPEMNGYEVLKALKETDLLTYVPFIFLTARSTMEDLRKGMDLGADDYLTKPFTYESLEKALNAAKQKKYHLVNQLNGLQSQLAEEKTKLEEVKKINAHGVRGKLSLMQGMIPFIKTGQLPLDRGLDMLEASGKEMDKSISQINMKVNGTMSEPGDKMEPANDISSIWLIDDDLIQNWITKTMLCDANSNWDIQGYSSPVKVLELLEKETPDLILLDINMPEMSGLEFLEKIAETHLDLRIIMLSSSVSSSDIEKSLSYPQVINYWSKPLKEDNILELLNY
ncbi:MAG: response regulator [Cyclobacteriaceae bacterium]